MESVQILMTEFVTHDVRRFIVEKPKNLKFVPGQGILTAIDKPTLEEDFHPFTPTNLNEDKVLEFMIKRYPKRHGLTEKLHTLIPGDKLIFGEVFGSIQYKGPGVFIAAGTGITPFVSIIRQLKKDGNSAANKNSLIFSNKTMENIILEGELRDYFRDRCIFTLTRQAESGYGKKKIDEGFLKRTIKKFNQKFYVCGPQIFVEDIKTALGNLGAKSQNIVFEE